MTAQSSRPGSPDRTAIGLDIGGTKIAGGVVAGGGTVLDLIEVPTPATGDAVETLEVLRKIIDSLRYRHPAVEAIGAGAAGMVEWPSGHIRWAPNNAYRELPLRQLLAQETGLPAAVDNDANVAAWAETRRGAASGHDHVVVLTVGTGIGAGVVLGGQLQRGHSGLGGEIGHIIVTPDGSQCGCGNTGCLEAMASGTTLGRAGREAAAADPDGILAALAGGTEKVTGQVVFDAAQRGDRTAQALFSQIGYWLGIGIASVVNLLDVELVVVGGGLVSAGELLLGPARESFGRFLFGRDRRPTPQIVPARFGPDAGVVGAATLALDQAADQGSFPEAVLLRPVLLRPSRPEARGSLWSPRAQLAGVLVTGSGRWLGGCRPGGTHGRGTTQDPAGSRPVPCSVPGSRRLCRDRTPRGDSRLVRRGPASRPGVVQARGVL